jgi:hypothetical protein
MVRLFRIYFTTVLLLPFQATAQCIGYAGPGGPCSMGPGGGLSMGPAVASQWVRVALSRWVQILGGAFPIKVIRGDVSFGG